MKKIIELAENICRAANPITRIALDIDRLEKELTKRKTLESTPITEDWLREHGFILEPDGYVFYDDSKGTHDQYYVLVQLRHNKQGARMIEIRTMWRSFYAGQSTFNVSFLLDACELCGINLEV